MCWCSPLGCSLLKYLNNFYIFMIYLDWNFPNGTNKIPTHPAAACCCRYCGRRVTFLFLFLPTCRISNKQQKENQAVIWEETINVLHVGFSLSERAPPLNLISRFSPPTLKGKELVGLLWNFFSMSELFTGLTLPFESCPTKSQKQDSLTSWSRRYIFHTLKWW